MLSPPPSRVAVIILVVWCVVHITHWSVMLEQPLPQLPRYRRKHKGDAPGRARRCDATESSQMRYTKAMPWGELADVIHKGDALGRVITLVLP